MFQSAGDLGLCEETLTTDSVVGVLVEDLLQRHFAVQLGVQSHKDGAQAAAGVGSQNAEPLALAGGLADCVTYGAIGGIARMCRC